MLRGVLLRGEWRRLTSAIFGEPFSLMGLYAAWCVAAREVAAAYLRHFRRMSKRGQTTKHVAREPA
jgi:hypothetical protein